MNDTASRPTDRAGFRFRGGHPALNLTATLAARTKAVPRELLNETGDLLRWLSESGLPCTGATEADLALARRLREAIYALARARLEDRDDAFARETLNEIAALPPLVPRLAPDGRVAREGDATRMLATIAREAVLLLGSDARIRACEGDGCSLLFVDASRRGDRRWCSMAGCGNRAKLADFRRRQRSEELNRGS